MFPFQFLQQGQLHTAHRCKGEPSTVLFHPLSLAFLLVIVPCKRPTRCTSCVLSQHRARTGQEQFCDSYCLKMGQVIATTSQVNNRWLLPLRLEVSYYRLALIYHCASVSIDIVSETYLFMRTGCLKKSCSYIRGAGVVYAAPWQREIQDNSGTEAVYELIFIGFGR